MTYNIPFPKEVSDQDITRHNLEEGLRLSRLESYGITLREIAEIIRVKLGEETEILIKELGQV